ncbi:hypothetical protein PsYK624_152080 [Phanerochaete sordida]|uniref:F-box domain-containing protein n=1 Tax=Phanerochaete sordida TaxID=48140 RepID=A0A9P3GSX2_9APHY|nr:hypothetical protein PsYK624_152080 [Phanerochaete sordida]
MPSRTGLARFLDRLRVNKDSSSGRNGKLQGPLYPSAHTEGSGDDRLKHVALPHLAQELIDHIIDCLRYDATTLRALTTVSRSWSARSSHNLLQRVYVQHRLMSRFAKAIAQPASRVLAHMTHLCIDRSPAALLKGSLVDDGEPRTIDLSPLLPALFALAPRLARLEIWGVAWHTELVLWPKDALHAGRWDIDFPGTLQLVGIDGAHVGVLLQQFRRIGNLYLDRILVQQDLPSELLTRSQHLSVDIIDIKDSMLVLELIEPLMERSTLSELRATVDRTDTRQEVAALNEFIGAVGSGLNCFCLRRDDYTVWKVDRLPEDCLVSLKTCLKLHTVMLQYWQEEDWDFIVHRALAHMPPVLHGGVWIDLDYRGLSSFTQQILDQDWSPLIHNLDRSAGLLGIAFNIESTWTWEERGKQRVLAKLPDRYKKMARISNGPSLVR